MLSIFFFFVQYDYKKKKHIILKYPSEFIFKKNNDNLKFFFSLRNTDKNLGFNSDLRRYYVDNMPKKQKKPLKPSFFFLLKTSKIN